MFKIIIYSPKFLLTYIILLCIDTILQPYGEIPTDFVVEFFDELGDTFLLLDRFKNKISIKFNKNRGHALMTENWLRVREVFGIYGNRLMLFTFLGNNTFFVNVCYENGTGLNRLPSDHSFRMTMEQPRHYLSHFFLHRNSIQILEITFKVQATPQCGYMDLKALRFHVMF